MKHKWPEDYGISGEDHCGDVLRGAYDVPLVPPHPPVILDIGANVGAFALWASKRFQGCTLHCYEPHPKMFDNLRRTVADNNIPNATIYEVGVYDKAGKSVLHESVDAGSHSMFLDEGRRDIPITVVDCLTLPEADILKIDAEGVEMAIIARLYKEGRLARYKAVMLEIHSKAFIEEIEKLMASLGFVQTTRRLWAEHRLEACWVRGNLFDPRPQVVIATPLRSLAEDGTLSEKLWKSLEPHYTDPINELVHDKSLPWQFTPYLVGGGGVARARNKFTAAFMKSPAVHLMMVDYDLMPKKEDYVRILTMAEKYNLPVIGGMYTTRAEDGHWVMNFPDRRGPLAEQDCLMQVAELGTGFKLYQKWGLKKIAEKNPWLEYWDDECKINEWGFFSMGPVKDKLWTRPDSTPETEWRNYRWLTEDYWLDWLTRDAELPIIADTKVKLYHKDGDTVYPTGPFPFIPEPGQVPNVETVAAVD
jgi:FkbM family methyltransferase